MWHLLGPVATRLYGYQPMSALGLGEDIPLDVYRDWKRWCQYPHYFFDDPQARAITEPFQGLQKCACEPYRPAT